MPRGIPRNVANTTIYRWGDKLIAGWEGGEPHALDPNTLETHGVETFNGLIAGKTTLAHMHHDPVDDTIILVNLKMGRYTDLEIHEVNSDKECMCVRTRNHQALLKHFRSQELVSHAWNTIRRQITLASDN